MLALMLENTQMEETGATFCGACKVLEDSRLAMLSVVDVSMGIDVTAPLLSSLNINSDVGRHADERSCRVVCMWAPSSLVTFAVFDEGQNDYFSSNISFHFKFSSLRIPC